MKKFFYGVFQQIISQLIIGVIAFGLFCFVISMFVAGVSLNKTPHIDEGFLEISLNGEILEAPKELDFISILKEEFDESYQSSPILLDLIRSLRFAANDPKVKGVLLKGKDGALPLNASYALLAELRRELVRFQTSGKPVYAYSRNYSQKAYYLASVADQLVIHPSGSLELKGLGAEQLYFSDALNRNGISVQVARAGKYKSAVEPFLRDEMSLEQREQLTQLLSSIWSELKKDISISRGIKEEDLQAFSDKYALFSASLAFDTGLVDNSEYIDMIAQWSSVAGLKSDEDFRIRLSDYKAMLGDSFFDKKDAEKSIGILYVDGNIVDGEGDSSQAGGDRLLANLEDLEKQQGLSGIVIRINSPGGSALAAEVVYNKLMDLNKDYPVVISMGGMAASGGYWIASASDYILSEKMSLTGSIGVWSLIPNVGDFAKQYGVSVQSVYLSEKAGLMSFLSSRSPAEMSVIQSHVDQVYEDFVDRVASSRCMNKTSVLEVSGGRVWTGVDALNNGLVDANGGLISAIEKAAQLAGVQHYRLEEYPSSNTKKKLLEKLSDAEVSSFSGNRVESFMQSLYSEYELMGQSVNTVQARLPYFLLIE